MSKILPMILAAGMSGGSGGGVTIDEVKRITGELEDLQTEHKDNLVSAINDLELFKFPNVTIIGDPTINHGQVTDFSDLNYLEFPFLVDFRGRSFEINFNFTTGTDIDSQQNILDSNYGLAFAIKEKHFLIALSINGTSWVTAQSGTFTLEPQTTYQVRISWNGLLYKVSYSLNGGSTYIDDITFGQSSAPYPKQMFIGVGKLNDNYFTGSINLNKANLKISNELVWQGMDDVGLATRLATDLSNIDSAGVKRVKDIAGANEVISIEMSSTSAVIQTDNFLKFKNAVISALNNNHSTPNLYFTQLTTSRNHYGRNVSISGYVKYVSGNRYQIQLSSNPYTDVTSLSRTYGINRHTKLRAFFIFYVDKEEFDNMTITELYSSSTATEPLVSITASPNEDPGFLYSGLMLAVDNTQEFTPTKDYHPATKKYVDDSISSIPTPTGGDNRFIHLEGGYNFYKNYDNSYERFGDNDKLKLQEYINSHYDGSNASNLLPLQIVNNYSTSSYSECDVLVITDVKIPYYGQINLLGYVNKLGDNLGFAQSHYTACYDVSLFATTTGDAGNYTLGIVGFRSRPRPISPDNITGYSRSGTQVLKNIDGTLTWVNE